jgi:hypothetical protein
MGMTLNLRKDRLIYCVHFINFIFSFDITFCRFSEFP